MFLFVAILFFRLIGDPSINDKDSTSIGNGLAQLQKNHGGRACLFILGLFLIIYGLFAVGFPPVHSQKTAGAPAASDTSPRSQCSGFRDFGGRLACLEPKPPMEAQTS